MSMRPNDVDMYGVWLDDLTFKSENHKEDFYEDAFSGSYATEYVNVFGKKIPINLQWTSDDSDVLGFECYPFPWEKTNNKSYTRKQVEWAIIKCLKPYVKETKEEIRSKIEEIHTYYYG